MHKIWLAGGCFWGVEAYFQQLKGVCDTTVGYAQGHTEHPTYEGVCSGTTGHTEVCEVEYDPAILPLHKVLEHYFRIVDPTSLNRQGPDRGTQYRTGIYYSDQSEKAIITDYIKKVQEICDEPIVVEVQPLECFFSAEEYHQDYLSKNPRGYCHIDLSIAKPHERS